MRRSRDSAGWPWQCPDGAQRNMSTGVISVSSLDLVLLENHSEKRQRLLQGLGTDAWKPSSCMPQDSEGTNT